MMEQTLNKRKEDRNRQKKRKTGCVEIKNCYKREKKKMKQGVKEGKIFADLGSYVKI